MKICAAKIKYCKRIVRFEQKRTVLFGVFTLAALFLREKKMNPYVAAQEKQK